MRYWHWLFRIDPDSTGWRRFIDKWLFLHAFAGVLLASTVECDLRKASNTVLLPLASVFVGLCFAWGGNAQVLLQTKEIESLAKHREGGIREYAFVYQTAILLIMTCLVLWGIAGLGVFDDTWPTQKRSISYFAVTWTLYCIASLTLRECWHVVLGAQNLLLLRAEIRSSEDSTNSEGEQG